MIPNCASAASTYEVGHALDLGLYQTSVATRFESTPPLFQETGMKKLISIVMSSAVLSAALALSPPPVSAKTPTQIKYEQKGAAAKAASKAKSDAKKH